jgi:hypothetical protein
MFRGAVAEDQRAIGRTADRVLIALLAARDAHLDIFGAVTNDLLMAVPVVGFGHWVVSQLFCLLVS